MTNETIKKQETEREAISAPILDYDEYRAGVADLDLTTQQENELLAILWDIMRIMCDLSLDMDAAQMIMPPSLYKAFNDETDNKPGEAKQQFDHNANTQTNIRSKADG